MEVKARDYSNYHVGRIFILTIVGDIYLLRILLDRGAGCRAFLFCVEWVAQQNRFS